MSGSYEEALARHGLEDVQPRYRHLLLRLKAQDSGAYEEAVRRYRDEVEATVDSAGDPVAVWVGYGAWLGVQIAPGTLKAVDRNGLAGDAPSPPPLGPLLMHLPHDQKARVIVIAMPADPSTAQSEAAALLCG